VQARLGDWHSGLEWIGAVDAAAGTERAPALQLFEELTAARVLARAGRTDEAIARMEPRVEQARAETRALTVDLLAAWAALQVAAGHAEEGRRAVRDAVRRAAVHGHIRAVLDAGPEIRPLLWELARANSRIEGELFDRHALRIAEAFDREQTCRSSPKDADRGPGFARLTARERQVLQLLSTGLSNREIADRLGTRVGTVKKQVSTLLWKIGARSRTHAAARARALRLVPPLDAPPDGGGRR
jgi:DNA-binding CsgD family transcriptional regulator